MSKKNIITNEKGYVIFISTMISNTKEWKKELSGLSTGITLKNSGDVFATSYKDTKMLRFNQYRKSDKTNFIINADLQSLIKIIDGFKIILRNHPHLK